RRGEMGAALAYSDWWWIALALALYSGVEALGAVRWRLLLRVQGFHIPWTGALRQLLTAMFFNLYSPAFIGGDAIRLFYLAGEHPDRKAAAVSAILMDRALGGASLLVLCALALVLRYGWLTQTPAAGWLVHIAMAAMLVAALILGLVLAAGFR